MISTGPTIRPLHSRLVDKGRRLLVRAPASLARRFSFVTDADLDAFRRRMISKEG